MKINPAFLSRLLFFLIIPPIKSAIDQIIPIIPTKSFKIVPNAIKSVLSI